MKKKSLRASDLPRRFRPTGSTASVSPSVATSAKRPAKRRLILKVQHRRLNGRGFGCYFAGSATRGEARIIIDCLGHEFMHALEDLFGVMFNEKAIEAAIKTARKNR